MDDQDSQSTLPGRARELSIEDITNESRVFLEQYVGATTDEPSITSPCIEEVDAREIGRAIRHFADAYYDEVDRKVQQVSGENAMSFFQDVIKEAFADGKYSWVKVALLFLVAYKFKARVTDSGLVAEFIAFAVKFIHDKVAAWILGQGGWAAILKEMKKNDTWKWRAAAGTGVVLTLGAAFYCGYKVGSGNV